MKLQRVVLLAALAMPFAAHAQPAPTVDLVRHLGLVVRVSSTVGNGRDLPAQLLDGDLNTAWSSRTGELVGARIEVDVPRDATVTAVALTPGFTRTAPQDLFRMNPRLARVEVLRDGVRVREATLDVNAPTLQTFPLEGVGGRWTVRALEVLPGSRRAWRELSVSEFQLLGRTSAPRGGAAQVWVDEARLGRRARSVAITGPFASADAWCAQQEDPDPDRCHSRYDEDPASNSCGCVPGQPSGSSPDGMFQLLAPQGPVRAVRVVRVIRDVAGLDVCVALVETARGVYALPDFAHCGEPTVAHDYTLTAHVDALTVTPLPGGGARITARIREQEDRADMSEVNGPAGTTRFRRVTLVASVNAAGDLYAARAE